MSQTPYENLPGSRMHPVDANTFHPQGGVLHTLPAAELDTNRPKEDVPSVTPPVTEAQLEGLVVTPDAERVAPHLTMVEPDASAAVDAPVSTTADELGFDRRDVPSDQLPIRMDIHWSLAQAKGIAESLTQLDEISNESDRGMLGNLYLTYQQQGGLSSAIDWAMAFTEVALAETPDGLLMDLIYCDVPVDVSMLATQSGYYVTSIDQAGPAEASNYHSMARFTARVIDGAALKIGAAEARSQGNWAVQAFTEACVAIFGLEPNNPDSEINPIIEPIRNILLYFVEHGYAPRSKLAASDINPQKATIEFVSREYDVTVEVVVDFTQIRAQHAYMRAMADREATSNMSVVEPEA